MKLELILLSTLQYEHLSLSLYREQQNKVSFGAVAGLHKKRDNPIGLPRLLAVTAHIPI